MHVAKAVEPARPREKPRVPALTACDRARVMLFTRFEPDFLIEFPFPRLRFRLRRFGSTRTRVLSAIQPPARSYFPVP